MKAKDGVVLAVEKIVTSKLYEPGTNKRIFPVDRHISAAVAGLLADARTIVERSREEASEYRMQYGSPIPIHVCLNQIDNNLLFTFVVHLVFEESCFYVFARSYIVQCIASIWLFSCLGFLR